MIRAVAFLLVLLAGRARAYDSRCYRPDQTECADGPDAAHNRWIGPSDEHRQLWAHTIDLAGLPALGAGAPPVAASEFTLRIFTAAADVSTGAGPTVPTLTPTRFAATERVRFRTMVVGEFAQLPDFGFALWDWATGLETCPLDSALPQPTAVDACHNFKTHMGAVNSNHFLPQAQAFFAYYHHLALDRAAACRAMKDRIVARGGTRNLTRFSSFVIACEQEAFVFEAVGHHFLQDAWATGHMWERWGSPDLIDFTDLPHALLVAMTSGLIHGARGVLQGFAPYHSFDVHDPLCAPTPAVSYKTPLDATLAPGLGDLYLDALLAGDGASFPKQYLQLFSCTVSAVRQVSRAMGVEPGPLDGSLFDVADPTGDACFGQRVTNRAMSAGIGLDFIDAGGTPHRIELDSAAATALVPLASAFLGGDANNANPVVLVQYAYDLSGIVSRARMRAALDPDGTDLARGGLGTLIGVTGNADFIQQPLAPYIDPPLPWPATPTVANDGPTRALALARTFHAAHATEWCNRFGPGADQLDVEALRTRVAAVQGGDADTFGAACLACETFAFRHLRVGTDADHYDTSREPLCFEIADDPTAVQYAYQDGGPNDTIGGLATVWCGCTTEPTTTTVVTTPSTIPVSTTLPSPPTTIPNGGCTITCPPGFQCCAGHFCCF